MILFYVSRRGKTDADQGNAFISEAMQIRIAARAF